MSEIAIAITEPNGKRQAMLLENSVAVRYLLPVVVDRLQLPRSLNYQLAIAAYKQVILESHTLAQAGVDAGADLTLQVVRDSLWADWRQKLYDEIEGHVKKKAWEKAESLLQQLLGLEPDHPDPLKLIPAVRHQRPLSGAGSQSPAQPALPVEPFTMDSRGAPGGTGGGASASATTGYTGRVRSGAGQNVTQPGKRTGGIARSCLWIVVLGGVVLVGLVMVVQWGQGWLARQGGGNEPAVSPEITLGTGDVQVTLRWDNAADLDLHVIDPLGDEIYYSQATAPSGGLLDVDANANCVLMSQPVENIFWPYGGAPVGSYQVSVFYYEACNTGPTDFTVTIRVNGEVRETLSGRVEQVGDASYVTSFDR